MCILSANAALPVAGIAIALVNIAVATVKPYAAVSVLCKQASRL